ncbi:uncharacterized protein LOC122267422 [Penaeus japonicus]|uniref:uncharacterized protein LOC122267422 n=1 Tax=Penaeus japonicus TaxID=27405 RepID=UPI001C70FEBA|nr:uncharacterized protein LOC122267422 [Penaeus japonicus]
MFDEQYFTLKSCWCFSLREGSIVISIARLMISILNLPQPCIELSTLARESITRRDGNYKAKYIICVILIIFATANVIGSIILIVGVLKRHRCMMQSWMSFVVFFIAAHVYNMFKSQGPRNALRFILSLIDIVFVSYCAFVIRSYYLSPEVTVDLQEQPSRRSDNAGGDEDMLHSDAERGIAMSEARIWVTSINTQI